MLKKISVFILALSSLPVMGQTPAALEMDRLGAVWFNSGNAAGMTETSLAPFKAVGVNYHIADGDYRKYTEGNRRDLNINVEGTTSLWKGRVWGKFTYTNITERDTRYNTLFLNLDEDNPFFVADADVSWWKKQKYELEMKASTPFYWDRLAFGVEAGYFTESGAKQIDPRGYGSEYGLIVKPAALLKLGRHRVGLALDYERGNMRMSPINNAYMNSKAAYILHGLGNSEKTIVSLITTGVGQVYDRKNQFGGSLQYGFSGESVKIVADLYGSYRIWDLSHTPSRPEAIGATNRTDLGANVRMLSENESFLHSFAVSGSIKSTDGIEYVQVFNKDYNVQAYEIVASNVKSKYSHTEASVSYDLLRKARDSYSWAAGAEVGIYSRDDRYVLPVSVFNCMQLYAEAHGKKQIFLKKSSLTLGANVGYCMGMDGKYSYQGTSADTPIVTDYFPHELAYREASWWSAALDVKFTVPVFKKNNLFIGAQAKILNTDNPDMKSRTLADISAGFIF